jgi:hypothetical protein
MKCIQFDRDQNLINPKKKIGDVMRVPDRAAEFFVRDGEAHYVPKSEWKKQVRNPVKQEEKKNESL